MRLVADWWNMELCWAVSWGARVLRKLIYFYFIFWKSISGGLWTQSPSTGGNSWRNCSTKVAVEVSHVDRRMHPSPSRSIFTTIVFAVNADYTWTSSVFVWVSEGSLELVLPLVRATKFVGFLCTGLHSGLVSTMLFAWLGFCGRKLKTVDTTGGSIWSSSRV